MSTTTLVATREHAQVRQRTEPKPIPTTRLTAVELRKMFDTRASFWMMASIVILSIVATGALIIFAPREELTYESFATAIGMPMAVILPMIAILSVTSEWSQRTALTTFTLVPSRTRVIGVKALLVVTIGIVSMVVAGAVGALGNLVGTTIAGVDTTWNVTAAEFSKIVLAQVLGMALGFTLGVVLRNSPAAIIGYFVCSLVLPGISSALAQVQDWWAENAPWFDFNFAVSRLYDSQMGGQEWAQIAVTTSLWVLLPLAIGMRMLLRSEVK